MIAHVSQQFCPRLWRVCESSSSGKTIGRIRWSRFVHFRCPPSGTNFISHNSIDFYMLSSNLLVVTRTKPQFFLHFSFKHQEISLLRKFVSAILFRHENIQCPSNLYYHRTCYSKFTNVTFIERAEVRCAKQRETSEMAAMNDQESEDETGPSRTAKIVNDNVKNGEL